MVGTGTRCLPSTVVAGWVAQIQLELTLGIPAGVDERDAEWPETTTLCVALLGVAEPAHQLLARDIFVVGQEVPLGGLSGEFDEDVGVGRHARHGADHVAGREKAG